MVAVVVCGRVVGYVCVGRGAPRPAIVAKSLLWCCLRFIAVAVLFPPRSLPFPLPITCHAPAQLPASAAMVRADIIAGLEAMERGVGPGKRTPTQPPVFCFCKAELFSSITVAGGADLGDLTLVNPDAQTAVLEAVPDREISVFDNLTPDGSLVQEAIETSAGNWTLYDRGPAPAPRRTAPAPPPGSGATPVVTVTPENTMPAGPWRSSAQGLDHPQP